MSRTRHHGNTSRHGKDLFGKRGNVATRSYSKDSRKLATKRVRGDKQYQRQTGEDA